MALGTLVDLQASAPWVDFGDGVFSSPTLRGVERADALCCLLLPLCQPAAHLLGNQPQVQASMPGGAC